MDPITVERLNDGGLLLAWEREPISIDDPIAGWECDYNNNKRLTALFAAFGFICMIQRSPGTYVMDKLKLSITTQCLNNALILVKTSRVTYNSQSESFISA